MNKQNIALWFLILTTMHSMRHQELLPANLGELEQFVNNAVEQRFTPEQVRAGLLETLGISLPQYPIMLSLANSHLKSLREQQDSHKPIEVYFNLSASREPEQPLPRIFKNISISGITCIKDVFINLSFNNPSEHAIQIRFARTSNERLIIKNDVSILEILRILESDKITWCSIKLTRRNTGEIGVGESRVGTTVDHEIYRSPAPRDQVATVIQRFYNRVFGGVA